MSKKDPNRLVELGVQEKGKIASLGGKRNVNRERFQQALGEFTSVEFLTSFITFLNSFNIICHSYPK